MPWQVGQGEHAYSEAKQLLASLEHIQLGWSSVHLTFAKARLCYGCLAELEDALQVMGSSEGLRKLETHLLEGCSKCTSWPFIIDTV